MAGQVPAISVFRAARKLAEAVTSGQSVGWAKRCVRRSSTSEGGSVPTEDRCDVDGGHGAGAPLPTLRSSSTVAVPVWRPGGSALENAAEHLFEDLALDVLVGELAVVPPPAVLLHLAGGRDEAAR